jgi:phenylacetate-CoA ligase
VSLYSRVLETCLLPAYHRMRGRRYAEYRRFLEASQWWAPKRLRAYQWDQTRALLEHVFRSVPYYQEKYRAAGARLEDLRSWEDFARLPVLTRQEVNAHRAELCSRDWRGALIPHATGGSSGEPTRFFITWDSYDWRTAATQRVYSWTGCRLGERAVYLWGGPVGRQPALRRWKLAAYYRFHRQFVFNTFSQNSALWRGIYQKASALRPVLLVGYVSCLEEFARFLAAEGLALPSVRAVIAAAEPLHAGVRRRLSTALRAPVYNTYGSREFMSLAGECEQRDGLHINAENIVLETKLPASEGPSEFLVTDLHNYGMPFLRYALGDVGELDAAPCRCGRGLPRLKSIEGRVLDVLRTPDRRVVPGEFFPHLLKDVPEVQTYQVRQVELDHIVVSAVLHRDLSDASRGLLAREVRKVFGDRVRVEIRPVSRLPKLASGKRRVTVGLPEEMITTVSQTP